MAVQVITKGTPTVLGLLALPGGAALTTATASGALRLLPGATSPGTDPARAVAGLTAALAALLAGWLTLCLLLAVLAGLPGGLGALARRMRDRITPIVVQRWAALVLGASATASLLPGTATAAVSTEPRPPVPGWHPTGSAEDATTLSPGWSPPRRSAPTSTEPPGPHSSTTSVSSPGWLPQRPAPRHRADAGLLLGRSASTGDHRSVAVVRRGDSLWAIAAAHLGADATDEEISRSWPRWHATNRDVIGPDPHALRPGTRLVPPGDPPDTRP